VNKKKSLTGKLNCEQKKQIIKSTVWNVVLYAAETWALTKAGKINCWKHLKCGRGRGCCKSVDGEGDK